MLSNPPLDGERCVLLAIHAWTAPCCSSLTRCSCPTCGYTGRLPLICSVAYSVALWWLCIYVAGGDGERSAGDGGWRLAGAVNWRHRGCGDEGRDEGLVEKSRVVVKKWPHAMSAPEPVQPDHRPGWGYLDPLGKRTPDRGYLQ